MCCDGIYVYSRSEEREAYRHPNCKVVYRTSGQIVMLTCSVDNFNTPLAVDNKKSHSAHNTFAFPFRVSCRFYQVEVEDPYVRNNNFPVHPNMHK